MVAFGQNNGVLKRSLSVESHELCGENRHDEVLRFGFLCCFFQRINQMTDGQNIYRGQWSIGNWSWATHKTTKLGVTKDSPVPPTANDIDIRQASIERRIFGDLSKNEKGLRSRHSGFHFY